MPNRIRYRVEFPFGDVPDIYLHPSSLDSYREWLLKELEELDNNPLEVKSNEPTITRIPDEEQLTREAQGATEESLDQWLTLGEEPIGPRERAFLEAEAAKGPGGDPSK